MRITFKKVEIHNFMSFADEVFNFEDNVGMNLICGKNNDIAGNGHSTNGCGKCLDPSTTINIEVDNKIYNDFLNFKKDYHNH